MQSPTTFFLAFIVVLALIGLTAWLVRRFGGNRLGANANRGRMPRLAVIDAAAVDGRRRLVLVRRDNIEHLLMIGGPTDIVVEQNIVRATPARDPAAARPGVGGAELPPRAPLPDLGSWSDGEAAEQPEPAMPEPPRTARPSFVDEVRRPASASERRSGELLPGFAPPEPPIRPEPRLEPRGEQGSSRPARSEPLIPRPARPEPPKMPPARSTERAAAPPPAPSSPTPAAPASAAPSSADQNLAEMAQRLEAALRRPGGEPAEPRVGAPPVQPEPPAARPRVDAAPPVAPPPPRGGFENLEDEMASLLGRPKSPS
jgi:flagellar protein FliO/FliZ